MESLIARNKHTCGGSPVVRGTRITTLCIKYWYEGIHDLQYIANMYNLSIEQVKSAINYKRKNKI